MNQFVEVFPGPLPVSQFQLTDSAHEQGIVRFAGELEVQYQTKGIGSSRKISLRVIGFADPVLTVA